MNKSIVTTIIIITLVIGFFSFLDYYNRIQAKMDSPLRKSQPSQEKKDEELLDGFDQDWVEKAKKLNSMEEGDVMEIISYGRVNAKEEEEEEIENDRIKSHPIQTDSEEQRRTAYEMALTYLRKGIPASAPECRVISQGYYQPWLVTYRGYGIFKVKAKTSFDCNEDYINVKLFTLTMHYLGNNAWEATLIDQKYLD